jgi:hypothetical protein
MWLDLKVVLLSCSDSACDHIWSIQGWILSKRRNRIGQDLVERLVRTHTNLQFEHRLELYERMGSLTVSLTPSLNPKMTLTKFLRHVTTVRAMRHPLSLSTESTYLLVFMS